MEDQVGVEGQVEQRGGEVTPSGSAVVVHSGGYVFCRREKERE